MDPVALAPGDEYLCLGVSWRSGVPRLEVVDVATQVASRPELMNRWVGIRPTTPARFCAGRYAFVDGADTEHVPCPGQQLAEAGGQCRQCASQDEFRFIHQVHRGGHASSALRRYVSQPHWVYVATFADTSSKIGTAADQRKKSRVDEQGAVKASYVARTSDGRGARHVEEVLTQTLAIPQSLRRAAKVAALASPSPLEAIVAGHTRTVDRVVDLLGGMSASVGAATLVEEWTPPVEMAMFLNPPSSGGWAPYAHDLTAGEHGFHIDACAGQAVLARTKPSDDAVRYVVDIGALKGLRFLAGDFVSPDSSIQTALF